MFLTGGTYGQIRSLSAYGGAITAMYPEVKGENKIRMNGYLASWNLSRASRSNDRKGQPKNTERTWPD